MGCESILREFNISSLAIDMDFFPSCLIQWLFNDHENLILTNRRKYNLHKSFPKSSCTIYIKRFHLSGLLRTTFRLLAMTRFGCCM
jgi:hypothetical protein